MNPFEIVDQLFFSLLPMIVLARSSREWRWASRIPLRSAVGTAGRSSSLLSFGKLNCFRCAHIKSLFAGRLARAC